MLQQAIYRRSASGACTLLARSPGFRDDWLPLAERLCIGFGERPARMRCAAAVFARPLDKPHVAVVQVTDQAEDSLGFRVLVIPRAAYRDLGGDPFFLAERFPAPWQDRPTLPALPWPDALPARTVAQVQCVLERDDGPTLLGASQGLLDGVRIVFERPVPDTVLLRDLWALLPTSTRAELWPASFVFSNALGFHVLVVPRAPESEFVGYLREEQAGDYPEGRYEFAVQFAVETGDQRELDRLFARRSRRETFRLGLMILGASLLVLLVLAWIQPASEKTNPAAAKPRLEPSAVKEHP